MASRDVVQDYANAINASWRKTTDSLMETAKLCAEADKKLAANQKEKLFHSLDFEKATFSKFVKIGSQQRLQTDAVRALLPPSYTIVYKLAKLEDTEFQVAIKEGIISPKMTRADLDAWIAERKGQSSEDNDEKERIIATLRVPMDYDDEKKAKLERALDDLRLEFGIAVERPRDPEIEALNRMQREIDEYIRKGARQYIRKLKATRFAGNRRLTPAMRKRLWSYSDDEIEIRSDATWEQVQYALDTVGSGDQFERLRDEAFRLHGVPEKTLKEHPNVNHEEAMKEFGDIIAHGRAMGHFAGGLRTRKASDFSDFK